MKKREEKLTVLGWVGAEERGLVVVEVKGLDDTGFSFGCHRSDSILLLAQEVACESQESEV